MWESKHCDFGFKVGAVGGEGEVLLDDHLCLHSSFDRLTDFLRDNKSLMNDKDSGHRRVE